MATAAGPSQTKKKLPFKPTALRKTSLPKPSASPDADESSRGGSYEDEDSLELFRRSREMAPIVAADRERRLKRKQKQKQKEDEDKLRRTSGSKRHIEADSEDAFEDAPRVEARNRKSLDSSSPQDEIEEPPATGESMTDAGDSFRDLATPPPSKRSRVGTASASSSKRPIHSIEEANNFDDSPSAARLRSLSKNATPRREPSKATATPTPANIISLDSDSDDDVQLLPTPSKSRSDNIDRASPRLSPPPEDDPFAEFVQKAAEERARFAADNDKIEIVITSTIEGSKPACFKFLFDKALRLARDSWVGLQAKNRVPLDLEPGDEIILTWRRKKVYNVSTLLSLGIRPRGDGRVATDASNRHGDGLRNGATRVHMEAWTPALFREMEQEEALQRRRDAGELSDDDRTPSSPVEPPQPEVKLRVILKARDLEPVKLTVRPETTVETLITGFRTQRASAVGSDQEVVLRWDGEVLEEHMTMEDAEIDDMDTIEVYVK